jgi:hypothetical protein
MERAADAQIGAKSALMPINDYLISGDVKERENFKSELSKLREKLEEIKKGGAGDKEKQLIAKTEASISELELAGMSIAAVELQGTNAEMNNSMKAFDMKGDKVIQNIEELHEGYRKIMDESMKTVDKTEENAIKLLIIISIVSIILGMMRFL